MIVSRNKEAARGKKKACKNVESKIRMAGFMKEIQKKKNPLSYFLPFYLYFCSLITLSVAHSFFLAPSTSFSSPALSLAEYDSLKSWHSFELPTLKFWRLWVVITEILHISERLKLGYQFWVELEGKIKNALICLLLSPQTSTNMQSQSLLLPSEKRCRKKAVRGAWRGCL